MARLTVIVLFAGPAGAADAEAVRRLATAVEGFADMLFLFGAPAGVGPAFLGLPRELRAPGTGRLPRVRVMGGPSFAGTDARKNALETALFFAGSDHVLVIDPGEVPDAELSEAIARELRHEGGPPAAGYMVRVGAGPHDTRAADAPRELQLRLVRRASACVYGTPPSSPRLDVDGPVATLAGVLERHA